MFNTPPTDTPAQGQPSEGQGENWQERFKGLQREFNKLKTEHEAATARANDAEGSLRDTKAQLIEITKNHQTEAAALKGQLGEFEKQVTALTTEKTTLLADLGKFQSKETSRKAVVDVGAGDLLPFVDAGDLDVAGLEGDALTQKVQSFRNRIASWSKEKTEEVLAGSSPSVVASGSASSSNFKSADDMFDWLMNPSNQERPDYEVVRNQYLKAVK